MARVRKNRLFFLTVTCFILTWGIFGMAAEFPSRPITLIMPYPAGGSTDVVGRVLVNGARKFLGQPVICENKPGGGSTVGPSLLVSKPADGYHLGMMASNMPFWIGKSAPSSLPPKNLQIRMFPLS